MGNLKRQYEEGYDIDEVVIQSIMKGPRMKNHTQEEKTDYRKEAHQKEQERWHGLEDGSTDGE